MIHSIFSKSTEIINRKSKEDRVQRYADMQKIIYETYESENILQLILDLIEKIIQIEDISNVTEDIEMQVYCLHLAMAIELYVDPEKLHDQILENDLNFASKVFYDFFKGSLSTAYLLAEKLGGPYSEGGTIDDDLDDFFQSGCYYDLIAMGRGHTINNFTDVQSKLNILYAKLEEYFDYLDEIDSDDFNNSNLIDNDDFERMLRNLTL